MDLDLDNLSFEGLDEAEKQNDERLKKADALAAAIDAETDCEGCKI